MQSIRLGGGRASGALSNTGTTVRVEELITQLKENFETQMILKEEAINSRIDQEIQKQKQEIEHLVEENRKLKTDLDTTIQLIEKQKNDSENKASLLEAKLVEQEKKVEETLNTLEDQTNDLNNKNDILNSKQAEQWEKIIAIQGKEEKVIKGINNLLTYTLKTNFEQCDIISYMKSLNDNTITPELQDGITIGLQKEAAEEILSFFETDKSIFELALSGAESLLTNSNLTEHNGENSE